MEEGGAANGVFNERDKVRLTCEPAPIDCGFVCERCFSEVVLHFPLARIGPCGLPPALCQMHRTQAVLEPTACSSGVDSTRERGLSHTSQPLVERMIDNGRQRGAQS